MFNRILVPFDGFGLADGILPFIPQLAEESGSSVILLWVMEPNKARPDAAWTVVELEEAAKRLSLAVEKVVPMVTVGSPAPAIVRMATEEGCDLIAIATHGRGAIGRGLFGSVADEVVRYSPVPVMVFAPRKADKEWGEDKKIERIVVPLDGSSDAETVLPYVAELSRRMKLEIILIRVSDRKGTYGTGGIGLPFIEKTVSQLDGRAETAEGNYLEKVTQNLRKKGLKVNWELLEGNPAYRATEFARQTKHNMVALANRGHAGIERWIEGSVSEREILKSGDPVLIIPLAKEESEVAWQRRQRMVSKAAPSQPA